MPQNKKDFSTTILFFAGVFQLGIFAYFSRPTSLLPDEIIWLVLGCVLSFCFFVFSVFFVKDKRVEDALVLCAFPLSLFVLYEVLNTSFLQIENVFVSLGMSSALILYFGSALFRIQKREIDSDIQTQALTKKTPKTYDRTQLTRRQILNVLVIGASVFLFLLVPCLVFFKEEPFSAWNENHGEALWLSFVFGATLAVVSLVYLIGPFLRRSKVPNSHFQYFSMWLFMGCFFLACRYLWALI